MKIKTTNLDSLLKACVQLRFKSATAAFAELEKIKTHYVYVRNICRTCARTRCKFRDNGAQYCGRYKKREKEEDKPKTKGICDTCRNSKCTMRSAFHVQCYDYDPI